MDPHEPTHPRFAGQKRDAHIFSRYFGERASRARRRVLRAGIPSKAAIARKVHRHCRTIEMRAVSRTRKRAAVAAMAAAAAAAPPPDAAPGPTLQSCCLCSSNCYSVAACLPRARDGPRLDCATMPMHFARDYRLVGNHCSVCVLYRHHIVIISF